VLILSHRGYWISPIEKNKDVAFNRSFSLGFGTETDVRDCAGKLVISHDMPDGNEKTLEDFLKLLNGKELPLAINIKADGLAKVIKKIMDDSHVRDWFVFDMSIPDTKSYFDENIQVFIRVSEFEVQPPWLDIAAGVWLDAFDSTWFDIEYIQSLLNKGLKVCVVSPELHKRVPEKTWELIYPLRHQNNLMLCTDYPEKAKIFFGEIND
jgi:hypothetical protein